MTRSSARASSVVIGGRWASRASSAARATSWALPVTGWPLAKVSVSSMPTRRWPPADRAASATGSVVRPMPVADQEQPAGSAGDRGDQRRGRAGHAAGDAHDQVAVDLAAVGRAVGVQQPVQRGHVAEVEQLELRDDLGGLGALVELDHERPRVLEDVVAEVDRAAGQRARVRLGVEDPQPVLQGVGDRSAGAQLDDQGGRSRSASTVSRSRPRSSVGRALSSRMWTWTSPAPAASQAWAVADQLVQRDRQGRNVRLRGLGPRRGDGDQRPSRCSRRHRAMSRPYAGADSGDQWTG